MFRITLFAFDPICYRNITITHIRVSLLRLGRLWNFSLRLRLFFIFERNAHVRLRSPRARGNWPKFTYVALKFMSSIWKLSHKICCGALKRQFKYEKCIVTPCSFIIDTYALCTEQHLSETIIFRWIASWLLVCNFLRFLLLFVFRFLLSSHHAFDICVSYKLWVEKTKPTVSKKKQWIRQIFPRILMKFV